MAFTEEQLKLHEEIRQARSDPEFQRIIKAVAKRDRRGRATCGRIHRTLPPGLTGVVMVNADTEEWFNTPNKAAGWAEAIRRYGPDIAHPPMWMITLTSEEDISKNPDVLCP